MIPFPERCFRRSVRTGFGRFMAMDSLEPVEIRIITVQLFQRSLPHMRDGQAAGKVYPFLRYYEQDWLPHRLLRGISINLFSLSRNSKEKRCAIFQKFVTLFYNF